MAESPCLVHLSPGDPASWPRLTTAAVVLQGMAALMALNSLELVADLREREWGSKEHLHAAIEAMRLAFCDTLQYCADPAAVDVPLQELLSKHYAQHRWAANFDAKKVRTCVTDAVSVRLVILLSQPRIFIVIVCHHSYYVSTELASTEVLPHAQHAVAGLSCSTATLSKSCQCHCIYIY